jgi:hypothetical protein
MGPRKGAFSRSKSSLPFLSNPAGKHLSFDPEKSPGSSVQELDQIMDVGEKVQHRAIKFQLLNDFHGLTPPFPCSENPTKFLPATLPS